MFKLLSTKLSGCFEIEPAAHTDERGKFVKIFHTAEYASKGLETSFVEEYYSESRKGVLRGLHFQSPPKDHVKIVYCVHGEVMDVVVDLRKRSPTYGQHAVFQLSSKRANFIYIPTGMAHGFYTQSELAVLVYKVSSVHAPEHDAGILWSSAGIQWPDDAPILSTRDRGLPALDSFASPFTYE